MGVVSSSQVKESDYRYGKNRSLKYMGTLLEYYLEKTGKKFDDLTSVEMDVLSIAIEYQCKKLDESHERIMSNFKSGNN